MSVSSAFARANATFPVKFTNATDASLTYLSDPMHFPAPISPLVQSVFVTAFEYGFTAAAKSFHLPIARASVTIQNNYFFHAYPPIVQGDETEASALVALAEASIQAEIPLLLDRWENEHLPRLKANLDRLATMNLATVNPRVLPFLLDEIVAINMDNWAIHFKIVVPVLVAMQRYDELYADLFGGEEQDAHRLLVGLPSQSVRAGIGLSELARAAKAAGLAELVLAVPAADVVSVLERHPIGEYFLAALRDYLREFGLRQDLFDYTVPTWQEDPTIAIASIQAYLRCGHDARAEHARAMTSAVKALNAARARLEGYPDAVREQFETMVSAARAAYFLQEEHNFYIDQQSQALSRLLFLRLGARLAESGVLGKADDIFMLHMEELKLIVSRELDEDQIGAARMLVLEREADLERSAKLAPPAYIGAAPEGPPPSDSVMGRAMLRFFGGLPARSTGTNQIAGHAGSRGIVTGAARVARTLDEAKALQPGEILVAITTMPAWTPLFGTAAALVTEVGGPLSHAAIVAREYGLPAVVGAVAATQRIVTGQVITVDGSAGLVTIEQG
ncbi:MAG: hypothetical protein IT336_16270 [Thermomicrobiales bacterium]|nr:hypothetical protein [Thermomicrobiales bacterium]